MCNDILTPTPTNPIVPAGRRPSITGFSTSSMCLSFSWWCSASPCLLVDEWNEQRKLDRYHVADAKAMLVDLAVDAKRLNTSRIPSLGLTPTALVGKHRTVSGGHNVLRRLADSIVEVGYVYTYSTFFMNNGTYKSLINNGCIQRFPRGRKRNQRLL